MLVGGIDILGMYCVDLTPAIGKQVKLLIKKYIKRINNNSILNLKMLLKLYTTLNDLDYYKKMSFNMDRLLFLVDSATKK